MKKLKRWWWLLIILGIIIFGIILSLFLFKNDRNSSNEVKIINRISKYNYSLKENTTSLYQKYFYELKDAFNEEELNKKEITTLIAQLFVSDFYTLDNKINKNDIGGLQFIYPSIQENFVLKAQNTLYKYLDNNIYDERNQELPLVSNIDVLSNELIEYDYNNIKEAYQVKLSLNYEKDLGYPSLVRVIIIEENAQFYIVEID